MIWKLLRRNISTWQIAGYAVSTLIGLLIVLLALQFYLDVRPAFAPGEDSGTLSLKSSHNIVISKSVGLSSTLSGKAPSFSADEIDRLRTQTWSGAVIPFQAADYGVSAGLDLGGRSLSTALFFESVADSTLDVDPADWVFDPSQPSIPILISKDYLTLYNFGFAASGSMPMLSEGMISSVPLTVTLSGNGLRESFPAHIVGFSSWLNTVAVPQSFMDWAHARYGSGSKAAPSRLVVEITDAGNPAVEEYLDAKGYQVAGARNDLGRLSSLLTLLVTVIASIGALITLLSLGILVLSLYLLVQKNRPVISGLLLLGYTPGHIARRYWRLLICVNAAVTVITSLALVAVRGLWASPLVQADIHPATFPSVIITGIAAMAALTALDLFITSHLTRRCFR